MTEAARSHPTGPAGGHLRILHVSQPTDYGVARCVADLAADQVGRGWQVTVACPGDGWLGTEVRAAGADHRAWEARRQVGVSVLDEVRRLSGLIRSVEPAVVHLHSSKAGLAGRLAIRGRRPTLFHTHAWSFLALDGAMRSLALEWERRAAGWATTTICCSHGEAQQGRRAGIGGRIAVVPNAVDLSRPAPLDPEACRIAAREALGIGDEPLAVCVGRLAPQKGQDVLLAAWRAVREAVPRARLVLVGDGPDRERLARSAPPGAELAGPSSDPGRWLAAADVVTLPSRYDTTPLTLLEALATGRSVVVTAVPGVAEVVEGAAPAVGATVAPGDAGALAEALALRLSDRSLTRREGAAARLHAETHYDLRRWLDDLADLAQAAATGGRVSAPVVVNGRFLTMQQTGVQRYARNLLERLPGHVGSPVLVAVPPDRLVEAAPGPIGGIAASGRWHGTRGHGWEQMTLPRLVSRAGRDAVLLSPANWGPVRVRRQVAVFHDIAPQLHPELFRAGYRTISSLLTPLLVRRCGRVGATCGAVARDLADRFDVDPERIDIMEPGVGAPFDSWLERHPGPHDGGRPYCLMVGGHDRRKNAQWVLGWWPEVHAELGIELVITTRGRATGRFADDLAGWRGVSVRVDPDDEELCRLYAGALCLLWPSRYEGYGLPLLEAMSVGTPFLATDVGAARDLAVQESQILPLDAADWIRQLRLWRAVGTGPLREPSVRRARARSWDATAAAAAASLAALAGDGV